MLIVPDDPENQVESNSRKEWEGDLGQHTPFETRSFERLDWTMGRCFELLRKRTDQGGGEPLWRYEGGRSGRMGQEGL